MIVNIVDRRSRKYRWQTVNAVLENAWQDNGCPDSDQARKDSEYQLTYAERANISVSEAVAWGMAERAEVTLHLYDEGAGIGTTRSLSELTKVPEGGA